MLKKLIFLALLINSIERISSKNIVCYTTNWSQYRPGQGKFLPENIDPFLCTHLIYSFAKLTDNKLAPYEWNDDSTDWSKGMYERTTDLKKINPDLKILLAVGGWNMGSQPFIQMVNSETTLNDFVEHSVKFLKERKFDGLDLDWEYPTGYKNQFTKLVQKLKARYSSENLMVTAAVAAGKSNIDESYDIPALAQYLDFLNIMTYDYHGQWESFTGHNAPLYPRPNESGDQAILNIDFTLNYYIQNGYPANKINLGLATYGRSFTLFVNNLNNLGATTVGGGTAGEFTREKGFLSYYEICQNLNDGWTRRWNDDHKVPFAFSGNQWVGYDDTTSLGIKVEYAKSKNLGGVMFWAMDLDDFDGTFCNKGKYPLMSHVKQLWNGDSSVTQTTFTTPGSTSNTHSTFSSFSSSTTSTTISTTVSNTNAACYNGQGYYADIASNCEKYYFCQSTSANSFTIFTFNCPFGLLFDPNIVACNWADLVTCNKN